MASPEVGYPSYDDWMMLEPDLREVFWKADMQTRPFASEFSRMVGRNALREILESVDKLSDLDTEANRPQEIY